MKFRGFTLAELLIALGILGVIATFMIPKVLQAQQDSKFKSIAKEAAGTISEAYQLYKLKNMPTASTKPSDLTPFMNYVKYDTSSTIDNNQGMGSTACTSTNPCIRLHNGAMMAFWNEGGSFGGTTSMNAFLIDVDPDGKYSGSPNGPGKAVSFILYYDGKIRTSSSVISGTQSSATTWHPDPAAEPPWFSWD